MKDKENIGIKINEETSLYIELMEYQENGLDNGGIWENRVIIQGRPISAGHKRSKRELME